MIKPFAIVLAALLLAACGPGKDNKPMLEKDRQTLDAAKKLDSKQRQETEKQQQEVEKQAQ
jgi:uncharacterized membrane protein YgcG